MPSAVPREEMSSHASARFVAVDPAAEDGVSPVSRFTFEVPSSSALDALRLYQGELSEYHQQRIHKGELPNTLLEREVPVTSWVDRSADAGHAQRVMSQAQGPLDPGASYTWAWLGQGPLLSFAVGAPQAAGWRRLWPTRDGGFWGYAAYCQNPIGIVEDAGGGVPREPTARSVVDLTFEPGAHAVAIRNGLGLLDLGQDQCLHFEIDAQPLPELLVPPLAIAGEAFDPAPLRVQGSDTVSPLSCEGVWQSLGPGCVQVQDDRIAIVSPSSPTLWLLATSEQRYYGVERGPFVMRGFAPARDYILQFVSHLVDGSRYQGRVALTTASARPHVIINEVLANPLGAEPEQEWVELYNEGSSASDLDGWVLSDGAGESVLPSVVLLPGEYLVITSEQYAPEGEDVPIAEGVAVVRVPSLGSHGLGNSGEVVQLISESGQLQSRFAARGASTGGVSIARVSPEASDDDADSFAPHGEPGASPGARNTF
jgi:hypothetical protein